MACDVFDTGKLYRQIVINFILSSSGDTETKRKIYTLNWEKITRPKFTGGLGIRKEHLNKTQHLNLLWRFFKSRDKEWGKKSNK